MKKITTLYLFGAVIISNLFISCSNKTKKENEGIGRYQPIGEDGVLDTKTGIVYFEIHDSDVQVNDFIYKKTNKSK